MAAPPLRFLFPTGGHLIHDFEPRAGRELRVVTGQVDLAELEIERGVLERFVLGGNQALRFGLAFRPQALALAGLGIMRVIGAAPFDQPVPVLHLVFQRRRAEVRLHPCAQRGGTVLVQIRAIFAPKCPV